jgi:hypothetical protein
MRTEFERIKEGGRRLNFSGIKGKNYHSRSLFGLAELRLSVKFSWWGKDKKTWEQKNIDRPSVPVIKNGLIHPRGS